MMQTFIKPNSAHLALAPAAPHFQSDCSLLSRPLAAIHFLIAEFWWCLIIIVMLEVALVGTDSAEMLLQRSSLWYMQAAVERTTNTRGNVYSP
ncbi:hypothetical protein U9M48_043387 [Paspalum notatum var. saurae]|uniref:Uncharacterized protein n=1 Tax=Paspalum notatum var. saurae TaxID=547442 RepID=A0AAQ3XFH8_PASNO